VYLTDKTLEEICNKIRVFAIVRDGAKNSEMVGRLKLNAL